MELRHLRYFVAVGAHGSFNRAAQNLHLTQPALSRQVKDLEEELGVRLFERGKNSVRLTAAGERFYPEAREVLARVAEAVQRVRAKPRAEILRVGYAPSATAGILPRALERFRAVYPRARIELVDVHTPDLLRLAAQGKLDILITLEPAIMALAGFHWTELREVSPVLVMRADHPLARLKRIAPRRLRGLPLVGLGRTNFPDYVPFVQRSIKSLGFAPSFVALEEDGISTLFASVEAYRAAAVLADSVAEFLPRSLVWRPFQPRLAPAVAKIGLSATLASAAADFFVSVLTEAAAPPSARRRAVPRPRRGAS